MITIRPEKKSDRLKIRSIHILAFQSETEANIVDSLRESGEELISLVAEDNGEILGHILFSPVTLNGENEIMGLAPMAVKPERQNQGIGTLMVNEGLVYCQKAGYSAVVVLGHPNYYPRFGFLPAKQFGIQSEYNVPPEVFMVKELMKDALNGKSGTIKYHSAFKED